jgi:hypothetical protein
MAPQEPLISYSIDDSVNSICVELSYNGTILAILTGGRVKIRQWTLESYDWGGVEINWRFWYRGTSFMAMVRSGNGIALTLTNNNETRICGYNSDTDQWEGVTKIMVCGFHDGSSIIIFNVCTSNASQSGLLVVIKVLTSRLSLVHAAARLEVVRQRCGHKQRE